jgi:RNA polymerase sigma factor (sigma-70 family)
MKAGVGHTEGRRPPARTKVIGTPESSQSDVGSVLAPWVSSRTLLLRVCVRWARGNVAEAEDLFSDACLKAVESDRRGLTVADPIAFSTTIIANLARDRLRRARLRGNRNDPADNRRLASQSPQPDEQISTRERLGLALAILDRISNRQRTALLLRAQGDEYSCIAQVVGTTEQNARKLVQSARARVQGPG